MKASVVFKEDLPGAKKTISKKQIVDRKKQLIENQKIVKRKQNKAVYRKNFDVRSTDNGVSLKKNSRVGTISIARGLIKRFILWTLALSVSFILMLPLLIQIRSYLWEKSRIIKIDDDIIYNDFLINGIGNSTKKENKVISTRLYTPQFKIIRYRVKRGDTLFGIARKLNTSIDAIITANSIKNAYSLKVGSILRVPNMPGIYHRVKKGDTLSGLSRKYGVSLNKIADINDISSHVLSIGDRIYIPGASLSAWERAEVLGNVFKTPTRGRLTSRMGFRRDPFTGRIAYHSGIDIANRSGTPVYSSQFGRVVYTGYKGNYGKTIIIAHPHGYKTLYGHLSKILVRRGQVVNQGQLIGKMGNTGRSTGPHLHFEIHQYGKLVNPLKMIRLR